MKRRQQAALSDIRIVSESVSVRPSLTSHIGTMVFLILLFTSQALSDKILLGYLAGEL